MCINKFNSSLYRDLIWSHVRICAERFKIISLAYIFPHSVSYWRLESQLHLMISIFGNLYWHFVYTIFNKFLWVDLRKFPDWAQVKESFEALVDKVAYDFDSQSTEVSLKSYWTEEKIQYWNENKVPDKIHG